MGAIRGRGPDVTEEHQLKSYMAITDFANSMKDLIANPKAIVEIGKNAAAAHALTEDEKKQRDDAVAYINRADEHRVKISEGYAKLEKDKLETENYIKTQILEMQANKKSIVDEANKSAEKILKETNGVKAAKEKEIDAKFAALSRAQAEVEKNALKLEEDVKAHKVKVKDLNAREAKITQMASEIEARYDALAQKEKSFLNGR